MPFESVTFTRQGLRATVVATALAVSAPALAAETPLGVWVNDTGRGAIEIKQCGDKLCGHVVWVKDEADSEGCGRQIIGDVTASGGNVWGDGWIYSPERKKNYNVELTPQSDGTLKVKGYAGMKFLSRTMTWTKAPADLVRCGAPAEINAAAPPATTPPPAAAATAEPGPGATDAPKATAKRTTPPPVDQAAPAPGTVPPPPAGDREIARGAPPADDGIDVSGLAEEFGDVFTKKDGRCKVDTPWVKLDFDCGEE